MRQINLNILKSEDNLTDDDIDQIISIVGKRCRIKTIHRLRSCLNFGPFKSYGIFNRLIKDDNGEWSYIAGQSYPDEIKTLRQCILGEIK